VQLYLLRHADAETEAPSDDERFLSEKGMLQAQRVARFCEAHQIKPAIVFTSPLRRAHQTAAVLADKARVDLRTVLWLASGAAPENMLKELAEFRGHESAMIVGHEPDFSRFAAFLVGAAHAENIHIRKSTLALFSILEFHGGGARLEFSIPVKMM
jgi:phosphohistidine phosphatase